MVPSCLAIHFTSVSLPFLTSKIGANILAPSITLINFYKDQMNE